MPDEKTRANPFSSLIAVSSLIAAILFVAGFAYRWAYYYNFGIQYIVYSLSFSSFLITAIELIRTPASLGRFLAWVVLPLLLLNGALALLLWGARRPSFLRPPCALIVGALGLESPLIIDAVRALVIVYTVYMCGSQIGYETFRRHLIDSPANPLPAVTIVGGEQAGLACGAPEAPVKLIGDAGKFRDVQDRYRTCTGRGYTWRLIHKDDQAVYLFASGPAAAMRGRPLTLVVPAASGTTLIME